MAIDWGTVAELATAGGTLALAISTFASVRSANRAARASEEALLVGLQPLLVPSRLQDDRQKIFFMDGKHLVVDGGGAAVDVNGDVAYLAMSVRNAGQGIAVLRCWHAVPGSSRSSGRISRCSGGTAGTFTCRRPTWGSGRLRSVTARTPSATR